MAENFSPFLSAPGQCLSDGWPDSRGVEGWLGMFFGDSLWDWDVGIRLGFREFYRNWNGLCVFPYINGILHGFPALGSKETFHRIKAATDMIYPPLSRTSHSSLLIQTMRCWTAKIQNWWEIWRQKPCFTTAHHGSPRWRTSYSSWKRCARRPLDPVWNTADGWKYPLGNSHITMDDCGKIHHFSREKSLFPSGHFQ